MSMNDTYEMDEGLIAYVVGHPTDIGFPSGCSTLPYPIDLLFSREHKLAINRMAIQSETS